MRESMQVTIGDAGVGDAVEAGELEVGRRTRGWRRAGRRSRSTAATLADASAGRAQQVAGRDRPGRRARKSTSASTAAISAQTAAPVKTVCSWAMPATWSRSVNSAQRLACRRRPRDRRQVGLLGVVAAQPDRGQRGDADQHPDHPGDDDEGAGQAVHVVVGAGQHRRVDRREREAEAEAAEQQGQRRDRARRGCSSPSCAISRKPTAAQHHARPR